MSLTDQPTYYDVLDVKPDSPPQEIREAYLRIKATYNKDSVALYTLISSAEREDTLRMIEEAYEVLSNPQRRRDYDRSFGLIDSKEEAFQQQARAASLPSSSKVISIDRVPPMESQSDEDLLVPPSTDFSARENPFSTSEAPMPNAVPRRSPGQALAQGSVAPVQTPAPAPATTSFEVPVRPASPRPTGTQIPLSELHATLQREIDSETDWSGLFLRRVREARRISIEEMSSITKITKTYLLAVEEEQFAKLPASVYVRGFVNQIARTLKLPADRVVTAYMARFTKS